MVVLVFLVCVCSTFLASGMLCFSPLHPGLPSHKSLLIPPHDDGRNVYLSVSILFPMSFFHFLALACFSPFLVSVIPTFFLREQKRPVHLVCWP